MPAALHRVAYATMSGTDASLLELVQTNGELRRAGVRIYPIAREPAKPGRTVTVYSAIAHLRSTVRCTIEAIVPKLREDAWEFDGSYRLGGCALKPGMSGSPMISDEGEIVGVVNSGNESGERCTTHNPCEIDELGNVTAIKGAEYGQQVSQILTCLDARGRLDVNVASCRLTRKR